MRKILVWPYQIYSWLIFVPYLGLSTIFFAGLTMFLVVVAGQRVASRVSGSLWTRLIAYMTPIFVKVEGRDNIDKKQSYVVISNHQSLYDIAVLYGWLGIDIRWVMKKELRKIPGLGIASEKVGHIFLDRSSAKSAAASLDAAREVATDGTSVVFFPEGTRSDTGELGKFRRGAFKLAADLGLPILPVAIVGTKDVLPAKSVLICPGKVKMVIHKPISVQGNDKSDVTRLMELSRQALNSTLEA